MNDLRLELRTRNNVLWHAIFDSHGSVAEFSRVYVLDQGIVGGYLNLTRSPYSLYKKQAGSLGPTAQRLVDLLGLSADELFPPTLYSGVIQPKMAAEVESRHFVGLGAARTLALPHSGDADLDTERAAGAIQSVLATLTPREQQAIELLYGLNGKDEMTRPEVAKVLGVSRSRIYEVELRALHKLRHPKRSRALRPHRDALIDVVPAHG